VVIFFNKNCLKTDKSWVAMFIASVRLMAMKCPVHFRLVKMSLYLSAPPSEETHWVQCNGVKCLAMMTKDGKWRCFATGKELSDGVQLHSNSGNPTIPSNHQT